MTFASWANDERARFRSRPIVPLLVCDAILTGSSCVTSGALAWRGLASLTLAMVATAIAHLLTERRPFSPRIFGSAAVVAYAWSYSVPLSLVHADRLREAWIMMTLQLLMASYAGFVSRAVGKAPYVPLAGLATAVAVITFSTTGPMRVFLAMETIPALLLQSLFAEFAAVGDESHRRTVRLEEALASESVATTARARDLLRELLDGSRADTAGLSTMATAALERATRLLDDANVVKAAAYRSVIDSLRVAIESLRERIASNSRGVETKAAGSEIAVSPERGFIGWGNRWLKVLRDTSPGVLVDVGHMTLGFGLVLALGAWIPYTSDVIGLHPARSIAFLVAAQVLFAVTFVRIKAGHEGLPYILTGTLGQVFMEAQCSAFVSDSSAFGAYVYASFVPVVTGWSLVEARVSLREPYAIARPVVVAVVFAVFAPTPEKALLIAGSFGFAIVAALAVSPVFRKQDTEHAQQAALAAEIILRQETAPARELVELGELARALAGRAHDVAGPLLAAGIAARSFENALGRAASVDDLAAIGERAVGHCRAMVQIVEETRRTMDGRARSESERVAIDDTAKQIAEEALELRHDIAVDVEGADVEVAFPGGRQALARAIRNVVLNAAKWSRSTVRIVIEASPPAIVIEDDGPGFTQPWEPVVLLPLDRAASGGLGLHVTKQLLESTGGGIAIGRSSELGGARVVLTLGVPVQRM